MPPTSTSSRRGTSAANAPIRDDPDGEVRALILLEHGGYTLADYLEQHLGLARRDRIVTDPDGRPWPTVPTPSAALRARPRRREPCTRGNRGEVVGSRRCRWRFCRPLLASQLSQGPGPRGQGRTGLARRHHRWRTRSPVYLAPCLAHQGRDETAERAWCDAIAAGETDARTGLARWLGVREARDEYGRAGLARGHHRRRTRRPNRARRTARAPGSRRRRRTGPARGHHRRRTRCRNRARRWAEAPTRARRRRRAGLARGHHRLRPTRRPKRARRLARAPRSLRRRRTGRARGHHRRRTPCSNPRSPTGSSARVAG